MLNHFLAEARSVVLPCLLLSSILAAGSLAAVPGLISYQGRLSTPTGEPVPDGEYSIRFQIYDTVTGGTSLWDSGVQSVQVTNGTYSYPLGKGAAFPDGLFEGGNRWLGITVGADPELLPRKQMIATAYAFVAMNSDSVEWSGIKNLPADFADGTDDNSGGDITAVNTSGGLTGGITTGDANVAIANGGVTSAHIGDAQILDADISGSANIAPAKINGTAATLGATQTFTGSNKFTGLVEFGDSTMKVNTTGVTLGRNQNPTSANLIRLERNYTTGSTRYGIFCDLDNTSTGALYGVYSRVEASTPGNNNSGNATGMLAWGISDADVRIGLTAAANAKNLANVLGESYGVYATAQDGSEATGVYTRATSATTGRGLYAEASGNSFDGYAIQAFAIDNVNTGYGLWAEVQNCGGSSIGVSSIVSANPENGYGVYGRANNNVGNGFGIYGTAFNNGGSNWAGYFANDVNVIGTIFTPAKITRIDHPLDPENQILQLSGIDSPEMKTFFDGIVTTDANGESAVNMPSYFDVLNHECRYQLTVIGDFAQAIIKQKIENGVFVIKTDKPGVEVSWQVTAIRKDAFARANQIQVESQKPADERGLYIHPAAFGLDRDRGIDYKRESEIEQRAAVQGRKKPLSMPAADGD